jgi:thioredoxin-related protein
MKTKDFFIPIFLIAISFAYSNSSAQQSYSYDDGLSAAKSQNKKALLYIYSTSDNWSKKMDAEVFSTSKTQEALSNFILIKINADTQDKLAKQFGTTGFPTFVILNPDGSVIKFKYNGEDESNISGYINETDFPELLNYFAQGKYKDADLSSIFQN